jgi:5'-methylthioadenosine phosphorylase
MLMRLMKAGFGIIGGTGIGERLQALPGVPVHLPTRHGCIRGRLIEWEGSTVLAVSRHSAGHKVPPHAVNYLGIAEAMKSAGVAACFATAAVGSLRLDWTPGTIALCADTLDVSARNITQFERTVAHADVSSAFHPACISSLVDAAAELNLPLESGATYVNVNGPRYETPAEIRAFQKLGGDIVGMTAGSEAMAMAESGVPYACVGIVTNLASGLSEGVLDHGEVVDIMKDKGEAVVKLLLTAGAALAGKRHAG